VKTTNRGGRLWPATQLLVTAETAGIDDSILSPRSQLRFLAELSTLAGPDLFAESLVYSTPRGNTGWTAFRMGRFGHATYHHWDNGKPSLLQLDLFGIGAIDEQRAVAALEEFWKPKGSRIVLARRPEPTAAFTSDVIRDDLEHGRGRASGLGPGDHLHLMLDQSGPMLRRGIGSPDIDVALEQLVDALKMQGMTPVMRHDHVENNGLAYDAIIGITTSHISLRLRQAAGRIDLSLDVSSCRKFDPETVLRWVQQLLPPPQARRAILYNRHPANTFEQVA
jgi:hypothetical protein